MILVAVGTFVHGFDALVEAADKVAELLDLDGFAQIGHSAIVPQKLRWAQFLPSVELATRMAQASLVICHGGMGLLGDAMRAGRPIIAVPRRGPTTRGNPAGDQTEFLRRLAQRQPIALCEDPGELAQRIPQALEAAGTPPVYDLATDVPERIASFLRSADR